MNQDRWKNPRSRLWLVSTPLLLQFALALCVSGQDDKTGDLEDLVAARQQWKEDILRQLAPTQKKYRGALEQYMRAFTRQGELVAAKEAKTEIERVDSWTSVPAEQGQRTLVAPKLNSLLQSYEAAVSAELAPLHQRYAEQLQGLKQRLALNGDLTNALKVDAEIKKLQNGAYLPDLAADANADEDLSGFSKQEFAEWLTRQTFEFTGKVAGKTGLKFDGREVAYGNSNPVIYDYEVKTSREVSIGGRFRVKFAKNLKSGHFISSRGEYPLRINPGTAKQQE